MQRRRRRVSTGSGESNASQLLALSLFLMLLAFFIVLNAISNFEETRVKPILQSIEQSFNAKTRPVENNNPSVQQSSDKSIEEGEVTERLEALFSSQIPEYESATNNRKGIMHVRLPYDEFYNAVTSLGRGGGNAQAVDGGFDRMDSFFLPSLIAIIRTQQAGMPYRMDMILNVGDNPPHVKNNNPQFAESRMKAMAQISQRLQNSGLPVKLQSIGLGSGPRNTVDLLFRPHVPFDPTGEGDNDQPE